MLGFIQGFIYYGCFEVIEPNFRGLEREIEEGVDVEGLMRVHSGFLEGCLKECGLSNGKLVKVKPKKLCFIEVIFV